MQIFLVDSHTPNHPGLITVNKITECDQVRSLNDLLQSCLLRWQFAVTRINTDVRDANKLSQDLIYKQAAINLQAKDEDLVVEFRLGSVDHYLPCGYKTFFRPNTISSERLAFIIQAGLRAAFAGIKFNHPDQGIQASTQDLLGKVRCNALIVNPFYITQHKDLQDRYEQIIKAVSLGILEYVNQDR